jgi:prepilin-type processing-associated H-X9-DG protein
MIYSGGPKVLVVLGVLHRYQPFQQPRAFYCPSETNPRQMFDTEQNPWPPGPEGASAVNVYAGYGCRPEVELPDDLVGTSVPGFSMPRLRRFKNKAILADLTANAVRVDTRHKNGVNVLYGDGSAMWVSRTGFNIPLIQCVDPFPPNTLSNAFQDQIWDALDRK